MPGIGKILREHRWSGKNTVVGLVEGWCEQRNPAKMAHTLLGDNMGAKAGELKVSLVKI